ncbi:MAG: arylsulfatase [Verrucomicrobia bacterium]|nr:arylsulfatase [Verrucomicrobiota bacterium]MDA1065878.1 arylsulfatase [Verrucomicrobiota bacterium]
MQRTLISVFLVLGLLSSRLTAEKAPNIILVLTDDMGYSDAGCFGGEIQTPNLDSLAENGLRFSQMYSTGRCWPSRAVLMTGYYAQQVGMDPRRGTEWPSWSRLLPLRLKEKGYRSYHVGKWHLKGMPADPEVSGFDRSFYLGDQDRFFSPTKVFLDDQPQPRVERDTGFYSTVAKGDYAIQFLQEHADKTTDQPFFLYLAFFAPHFPLQALPEDIENYQDVYLKGWDVVRKERWARLTSMGLVNCGLAERREDVFPPWNKSQEELVAEIHPGEVALALPWDTLTAEQKDFQATKMAIHAAMIDRVDQEIGRVMNQIKGMGEEDNTVFIFVSDNGASGELMNRGDIHDPSAPLGSAGSYLCLGPGWSTAANTPLSFHKHWNHEGGISSPMVVHWPQGIQARGEIRHTSAHFIDVVPTILDLVGVEVTPSAEGPALPGRSLVPVFGEDQSWEDRSLFWAHSGNQALRRGDWKAVLRRDNNDRWELYKISEDRAELNDLATAEPKILNNLASTWEVLKAQYDADFEVGEAK